MIFLGGERQLLMIYIIKNNQNHMKHARKGWYEKAYGSKWLQLTAEDIISSNWGWFVLQCIWKHQIQINNERRVE